jgi:cell division protein FtsB
MSERLTRLIGWQLPGALLRYALLALLGLGALVYLNFPTIQEYFHTRDRRDRYRDSVESLRAEHERLLQEQAALQTDGFDKEKAIRERLLMIKPGERVILVETPDHAGTLEDPASAPNPPVAPNNSETPEP